MENINDIIKESKQLLEGIHGKEIQNEPVNNIDTFRSKLLNFINNQLEPIKRTQDILDLVDAAIIRKLMFEEYDKNELLDLRRELTQSANLRTSVLLDPFKPTNGGGNTLITPPSVEQASNDDISKKLTPEERVTIEKLYAVLSMKKKKNKIIPDTGEEGEE